jgi:hypothetical protein
MCIEQLPPHFKTHGATLDLFRMLLEQLENTANWKTANMDPYSFSVSQWEERKVLCVTPSYFECIGIEQITMCKEQPLSTFKMEVILQIALEPN